MTVSADPADPGAGPLRFRAGVLSASLNRNGSLRLLRCGDLTLNLFPGSEAEGGPANLVLRRWAGGVPVAALPLCGPESPLRWREAGADTPEPGVAASAPGWTRPLARRWREATLSVADWPALRLRLELVLAVSAPAWFWHLAIDHLGRPSDRPGSEACTLDIVYLQDVGLAPWGALRLNEAYVSQYLDHQPIADVRHGWLLATRQNQPVAGRNQWLLSGSLGQAVAFATDALQFVGPSRRAGLEPRSLPARLPSQRLQHEHALVALQEHAFVLAPGESARRGFFGWYEADHPASSTPADADRVALVLALPEANWSPPEDGRPVAGHTPSLLARAPRLDGDTIDAAVLAAHASGPWRHVERDAAGALQSFFCGDATHAVLTDKDRSVLRPHGHLLRSGGHATPDERATASTVWMAGVFHSSLTQGHASANRLLSTQRGYLGLARGQGLRAFVDWGEGWQLLEEPSAWLLAPDRADWIYRAKNADEVRELIVSSAATADPAVMRFGWRVTQGAPPRVLLLHHAALDGDDGLADRAPTWREEVPGTRLRIEPAPDTEMARRFPGGGLVIEVAPGSPGHATAAAPAARADPAHAGTARPHVAAAPSAQAHAAGAAARQAVPSARWSAVTADEALYDDGRSRAQPYLCVRFDGVEAIELHYRAELIRDPALPTAGLPSPLAPVPRLQPPEGAPADTATGLRALAEWLPWLQHNALVHYLSPRGLEQFSGGGWGTRDVCQGPVELMSAHGRHDVVRDLLCRVFSAQNPDGDWPQWFMFFPRDAAVRAGDSHGDIVFWPLLALAEHLAATGDAALLDEPLPYHGKSAEPLHRHAERAFAVIAQRRIAGTALAAYGHGDWNDALQPADPAMRDRLCSAWTVTLHYKLLRAWGQAWRRLGQPERAAAVEAEAAAVLADFQRLLVADGVLAGYASFDDPAAPRLLLHPRDAETGIRYSALAMVHAIIDELFTPEQAAAHAELLSRELSGPDGLRLFDRPLAYRGGPMKLFQRGESASYFGREIGLMYMHAHLRWAEALAQLGRGDALLHALRLANPIGLQALVPTAAPRQASCYYSSSDAAFADRHEAAAHYDRIARGEVALEGGWRIYSSGAGIAWRLVVQRLLGLTQQAHRLIVDPVLPRSLDGLQATVELYGVPVRVSYRVGPRGHGPVALRLNGRPLLVGRGRNRYRAPGVEVAIDDWRAAQSGTGDRLEIVLG